MLGSRAPPHWIMVDSTPQHRGVCGIIHSQSGRRQNVRFSNRPFGVKRFRLSTTTAVSDVAHGLVLLFGIGTRALPSWDLKMRWNNLMVGLAVKRNGRSKRTCELQRFRRYRTKSKHNRRALETLKTTQRGHFCRCMAYSVSSRVLNASCPNSGLGGAMKRRDFLCVLSGVAAGWPHGVKAQQAAN